MNVHLAGVPRVETARLVLRAPQTADFETYAEFIGSERSHFVGGPIDRFQAWRSFGHQAGHWALRGYGMFVITEKDSDRPLGLCGGLNLEGWPEPELAWQLWSPEVEGRGIASEAVRAVRACLYRDFGWSTAISMIDSRNSRSAVLAERLGARLETPASIIVGKPYDVWRHPDVSTVLGDGGAVA